MPDKKAPDVPIDELEVMGVIAEIEPDYHKKRMDEKTRQPGKIIPVTDNNRIEAEAAPETMPTTATKNTMKRPKDHQPDYSSVFLSNTTVPGTYQTYILPEVYCYIRRILPAIAPGVSIAGYINNILLHHMKQHQDFINEMYARSGTSLPKF